MISWDSNFLIRHLMADDESQAEQVRKCLAAAESKNDMVYVSEIVLVESFWVLKSAYKLRRRDAAYLLQQVARDTRFHVQNNTAFEAALVTIRRKGGDLGDQLILRAACTAKALPLYTFDQGLRGTRGAKVL